MPRPAACGKSTLEGSLTSEVLKAKWDEIKFAEKLWVTPAEEAQGASHTIVGCGLEKQKAIRSNDYAFAGRGTAHATLDRVRKRLDRNDLKAHRFR